MPALALEEVRLGVTLHNIQVIEAKNANKEDGVNINGELVFAQPQWLSWTRARPYVMASVNTAGDTSFAALGLTWKWNVAPGWAIEPSFGYAVHNGELENPFPPDQSAARQAFQDSHALMGSRDLFRSSLAISRDMGENWGLQLVYEHLSHGQILGDGRNQGLDELGVRVFWRY
jgi:lipid A 3-O-deacylase